MLSYWSITKWKWFTCHTKKMENNILQNKEHSKGVKHNNKLNRFRVIICISMWPSSADENIESAFIWKYNKQNDLQQAEE